jgi:hypothetical protein
MGSSTLGNSAFDFFIDSVLVPLRQVIKLNLGAMSAVAEVCHEIWQQLILDDISDDYPPGAQYLLATG